MGHAYNLWWLIGIATGATRRSKQGRIPCLSFVRKAAAAAAVAPKRRRQALRRKRLGQGSLAREGHAMTGEHEE